MLGTKMEPIRKLAKKVKVIGEVDSEHDHHECLIKEYKEESSTIQPGFFALYVGEEHRKYAVPTSYLSHPLFKMLLEKAYNEFGFEQMNGLVIPCSVPTFQEVMNVTECNNGKFDLAKIIVEFV